MGFIKKAKSFGWLMLIPLAALLCYLLAVKIVNVIDYHNNDYFTFYLAGHLVTQGADPYSTEQWLAGHEQFGVTWIPNPAFVYPLPLSLLFAPLGLLPLYRSYVLWVALSEGMILISIFLTLKLDKTPITRHLFLPLLAGVILFRPTILTLVNGQLAAWLLFLLTCIALLWVQGKWEWGSLLLPLLALKPNIGAPILLLLAVWLWAGKRYKSLLALGLGGILLLTAGMIQNPDWPIEYWNIGSTKLAHDFGFSPTVWGLASLACDFQKPCSLAAGGTATALLTFTALWLLVRYRTLITPLAAVSLSTLVTLLITPYTWPYDQLLLLLPIAAVVFSLAKHKGGFLPATIFFLGIDLLTIILLFFSAALEIEILNAFVPLTVLVLLLWRLFQREQISESKAKN